VACTNIRNVSIETRKGGPEYGPFFFGGERSSERIDDYDFSLYLINGPKNSVSQ